jgi:hypothetical protein
MTGASTTTLKSASTTDAVHFGASNSSSSSSSSNSNSNSMHLDHGHNTSHNTVFSISTYSSARWHLNGDAGSIVGRCWEHRGTLQSRRSPRLVVAASLCTARLTLSPTAQLREHARQRLRPHTSWFRKRRLLDSSSRQMSMISSTGILAGSFPLGTKRADGHEHAQEVGAHLPPSVDQTLTHTRRGSGAMVARSGVIS